ncbi:MAG: cell division protein FtsQ/DivIB [Thermodesulfobacteriota bacterium]|nr:cell division protein FtsQ/DivIB [Thermodesulfobacteriota bacterium]|tara:strand:- start:8159 stop:8836 length:678 start_codon:yes stop_codon:yes gene_type:complete
MKNKIKFYAILIIISIPIYGLFNPIFTIVKEIEISGIKLISKNEIIQSSELENKIITIFNKQTFLNNLYRSQDIKKVDIIKKSYSKVLILIEEREYAFVVNQEDAKGLIDETGSFYPKKNLNNFTNLPILSLEKMEDASIGLTLLSLLKKYKLVDKFELSEIKIDQILGVQIYSIEGQTILIGTNDFDEKIKKLEIIISKAIDKKKKAVFIDLRETSKGVVNYNL